MTFADDKPIMGIMGKEMEWEMANRVIQAKRLKIIKGKRKQPRRLWASNWSDRKYPNPEVLGEMAARSAQLARPLSDPFELLLPRRVNQPRLEAIEARNKVLLDSQPLCELVCLPDFKGRVQQMNKIEIIRGNRRIVTLHFRGNEWVMLEETHHYIRVSKVYPSYKHVMELWEACEENIKWVNVLPK